MVMTFEELMANDRFLKILQRVWDERGEVEVKDADTLDLDFDYGSSGHRIIKAFMQREPDIQRGMVRFAVCFEQAKREWLKQH